MWINLSWWNVKFKTKTGYTTPKSATDSQDQQRETKTKTKNKLFKTEMKAAMFGLKTGLKTYGIENTTLVSSAVKNGILGALWKDNVERWSSILQSNDTVYWLDDRRFIRPVNNLQPSLKIPSRRSRSDTSHK